MTNTGVGGLNLYLAGLIRIFQSSKNYVERDGFGHNSES